MIFHCGCGVQRRASCYVWMLMRPPPQALDKIMSNISDYKSKTESGNQLTCSKPVWKMNKKTQDKKENLNGIDFVHALLHFFCLCSMSQNGTMLVPHGQRLQLLVGYSL